MPTQDQDSHYSLSLLEFWQKLFSTDGFMPRAKCGLWTPGEIFLHNAADFLIWTAYLAIPIVLLFWWRRKLELPFRSLLLLFGMFIVACGTTHLMEIVMFYYPVYRLAGVIKFITAIISWSTVVALVPIIPQALAMQSPAQLEKQVSERTAELELANQQLELANQQKDELLIREQNARVEAEFARQEAEEANRAKDEFLMTLSHELRTPLNAIQGWSSLLLTDDLPPEVQKQAFETIDRSTQIQVGLIDDILEVSRIVSGKLIIESEPVALTPALENAMASLQPAAAAKHLNFNIDIKDKNLVVLGDTTRLQQIVWNLLSNAVKFTPADGSVFLTLTREDNLAIIEVSDTGKGISPSFLPYVFDRFRQADGSSTRLHGGLGLGLAIVRHLTELHGGSVTAASAGENQGAKFEIALPLYEAPALLDTPTAPIPEVAPTAQPASQEKKPLDGLKVLVVDDEPENRQIISTIIELRGAEAQMVGSADAARQVMALWPPDILVCDIGMPDENGYQLLQSLGNQRPKIALALTAYATPADKKHALDVGYDAHLSKPVIPTVLVDEICRIVYEKGLKA